MITRSYKNQNVFIVLCCPNATLILHNLNYNFYCSEGTELLRIVDLIYFFHSIVVYRQWRAEGMPGGATAPGIQVGGIQQGSFF